MRFWHISTHFHRSLGSCLHLISSNLILGIHSFLQIMFQLSDGHGCITNGLLRFISIDESPRRIIEFVSSLVWIYLLNAQVFGFCSQFMYRYLVNNRYNKDIFALFAGITLFRSGGSSVGFAYQGCSDFRFPISGHFDFFRGSQAAEFYFRFFG